MNHTGRAHGEYMRALSAGGVPAGCLRRRRDNPAVRWTPQLYYPC